MRGLPCYHEFYMSMSGGPTGNQNAVHANSMDQTQMPENTLLEVSWVKS